MDIDKINLYNYETIDKLKENPPLPGGQRRPNTLSTGCVLHAKLEIYSTKWTKSTSTWWEWWSKIIQWWKSIKMIAPFLPLWYSLLQWFQWSKLISDCVRDWGGKYLDWRLLINRAVYFTKKTKITINLWCGSWYNESLFRIDMNLYFYFHMEKYLVQVWSKFSKHSVEIVGTWQWLLLIYRVEL